MAPAAVAPGFSAADVGRLLLRERTRQGLSLREVGVRTGIPVAQLRAAETGALERRDGLCALKTVRRYADFLGLPGDRFALAILERWPTAARPALGALGAPADPQFTDPPTLLQEGPASGVAASSAPWAPSPDPVSSIPWVPPCPDTESQAPWEAFPATGVTPAVPAPWGPVARPRRGVRRVLQALVVLVALAVLAGTGVLALDRFEPSWLRSVGLARATPPVPPPTPLQRATLPGARGGRPTAEISPTMIAGGMRFVVHASTFSATLSASGGPCWVQVSADTSAPSEGVIDPGTSRRFAHIHALVVELGSTAGRLSVTSAAGRIRGYAPRTVPYKITVESSR
jgi:transcriptional regulator with XRE-family HTH domain